MFSVRGYHEETVFCYKVLKLLGFIFLDLFHLDCINSWALKFPENASVSTYQCPDCKVYCFVN